MSRSVSRSSGVSCRKGEHVPQGFKPVALPALAAAVQAVRTAPPPPPSRELPPLLRKELLDS